MAAAAAWLAEMPSSASTAFDEAFDALYGPELTSKYGCALCHGEGSLTELNSYGQAVMKALSGDTGCLEYYPPENHTLAKGRCEYLHAEGLFKPFANGCSLCHGIDLTGDIAPSCFRCHGELWDDDSAPLSFYPPDNHTIAAATGGFLHAPGASQPVTNFCHLCHGDNLRGGTGPSCYLCHGAVWPSLGEEEEFYPPNTHTDALGAGGFMHAPGRTAPISNGCTTCHGVDLTGLIAPSCYLCHGTLWTEGAAAPPQDGGLDAAFQAIENDDSDGDGYTNIEEILALTHPGDPTSFPGIVVTVTVRTETTWDRNWVDNNSALVVTLKPKDGSLTADGYVSLTTDDGSLFTTRLRRKGASVEAYFPKSLLWTLFDDLTVKSAAVVVGGTTASGTDISGKFTARLSGAMPALVAGLYASSKPGVWEPGEQVRVTIIGDGIKSLDSTRPIYAVGLYKRIKITDYGKTASKLTVNLDGNDVDTMLGDPIEGVTYKIGIVGKSTAIGETFTSAADLEAPEGGCYYFDAPGNHTVALKRGVCKYMHAPGYDTPYDHGCNYCHGSSLKGTKTTPSCYLCHGQLWSEAATTQQHGGR